MQLLLITFNKEQDPKGAVVATLKEHKNGECVSVAPNTFLIQTNTSPHNLLDAVAAKLSKGDTIFVTSSIGPIVTLGFPEESLAVAKKIQGEQFVPGAF